VPVVPVGILPGTAVLLVIILTVLSAIGNYIISLKINLYRLKIKPV
jgi:hypothetical protein